MRGRVNVGGGKKPSGTAIEAEVLVGKTFSNDDGVGKTGTMPNNVSVGTINLTAEEDEYAIPVGYHNGLGKVKAVITGLIASVIKAGTTVGGIVGNFTADATAVASHLLSGKTAYVNGSKITGTIPSRGATTITPSNSNQTIVAGQYLSGTQTIAGDADLISANIKSGATIFGVAGNSNVVDTSAGTVTSTGQILSGYKAYSDGNLYIGTIPGKSAQTFTPTTTNQTISAGQYLSGTQTILGSSNLLAGNIKSGVNIFGVVGTSVPYTWGSGVGTTIYTKEYPTAAMQLTSTSSTLISSIKFIAQGSYMLAITAKSSSTSYYGKVKVVVPGQSIPSVYFNTTRYTTQYTSITTLSSNAIVELYVEAAGSYNAGFYYSNLAVSIIPTVVSTDWVIATL